MISCQKTVSEKEPVRNEVLHQHLRGKLALLNALRSRHWSGEGLLHTLVGIRRGLLVIDSLLVSSLLCPFRASRANFDTYWITLSTREQYSTTTTLHFDIVSSIQQRACRTRRTRVSAGRATLISPIFQGIPQTRRHHSRS